MATITASPNDILAAPANPSNVTITVDPPGYAKDNTLANPPIFEEGNERSLKFEITVDMEGANAQIDLMGTVDGKKVINDPPSASAKVSNGKADITFWPDKVIKSLRERSEGALGGDGDCNVCSHLGPGPNDSILPSGTTITYTATLTLTPAASKPHSPSPDAVATQIYSYYVLTV